MRREKSTGEPAEGASYDSEVAALFGSKSTEYQLVNLHEDAAQFGGGSFVPVQNPQSWKLVRRQDSTEVLLYFWRGSGDMEKARAELGLSEMFGADEASLSG